MNPRKCGPSKWHMMLGLNLVIDDTLNLPGVGCCGAVNTPNNNNNNVGCCGAVDTPNNNNNNNIDIWDSLGLILLQKSVGAK